MYPIVTASFLRSIEACSEPVTLFETTFPSGIDVSDPASDPGTVAAILAAGLDVEWASKNFPLSAGALAEYERVRAPARAEYERVRAGALAEYGRVRAPAEAEYERVRAPAPAEFERVTAGAEAEYERVTAGALLAAIRATGGGV